MTFFNTINATGNLMKYGGCREPGAEDSQGFLTLWEHECLTMLVETLHKGASDINQAGYNKSDQGWKTQKNGGKGYGLLW